jgi:glyoxylase-like metal-dependent hydrolase (beta-lactamase superfamily II)
VSADTDSPVAKINAEAAAAKIDVQTLRGNLAVLSGSGGNITVLTGTSGQLMVDAGIAVSQERLAAALRGLGAGPLRILVDTHWHWDHTDGNAWVHRAGATVVAHANVLKRLSQTVRVEDWKHTFAPLEKAARPSVIVADEKKLDFEGETLTIRYYGPCHTDGDVSVYFQKADVLVTGDTWWNGYYPFIDYVTGGSIDGMIRAANANLALSTDATLIVPGHGPVGSRADLVEYRDMLVGIRENVAALKKLGKSLDEVIAERPTAAYDAKWGRFVIDSAFFTRLVYRGL